MDPDPLADGDGAPSPSGSLVLGGVPSHGNRATLGGSNATGARRLGAPWGGGCRPRVLHRHALPHPCEVHPNPNMLVPCLLFLSQLCIHGFVVGQSTLLLVHDVHMFYCEFTCVYQRNFVYFTNISLLISSSRK